MKLKFRFDYYRSVPNKVLTKSSTLNLLEILQELLTGVKIFMRSTLGPVLQNILPP